jgi:hypothetical protein
MKPTFYSKTILFNSLTLIAALVALPEVTVYVSPQTLLIVSAVVNILLRQFFTTESVSLTGGK